MLGEGGRLRWCKVYVWTARKNKRQSGVAVLFSLLGDERGGWRVKNRWSLKLVYRSTNGKEKEKRW